MKNIHVLQTDKPSRLFEILQFNFVFDYQNKYSEEYKKLHKYNNKNIYITDNSEIKEGDYCLYNKNHNSKKPEWELIKCGVIEREEMHPISDGRLLLWMVKIILTTDQDLIKDGIQSIDDEFLEWFVKNPSCESVEAKPLLSNNGRALFGYKIIIPKKEFKLKNVCIKCGVDLHSAPNFICQKHPKECKGIHIDEETLKEWANKEEQKQHLINIIQKDEELGLYNEPKQETLEEKLDKIVSKEPSKFFKESYEHKLLNDACTEYVNKNFSKKDSVENKAWYISWLGFKNGAKWQQEQNTYNYLPGFIKQFDPNEGELSQDKWTAVQFLKWLELNNFKIIK